MGRGGGRSSVNKKKMDLIALAALHFGTFAYYEYDCFLHRIHSRWEPG